MFTIIEATNTNTGETIDWAIANTDSATAVEIFRKHFTAEDGWVITGTRLV